MEKAALEVASHGGGNGTIFVLVGLAVILSGFAGMLWWFIRDKISTIQENFKELKGQHKEDVQQLKTDHDKDVNRITDEHAKFKEWFDGRLHHGADTMTQLKNDIKKAEGDILQVKGDRVRPEELRACKREHEMLYKEQERSIERLTSEVAEVKESLVGIDKKVDGGFEMLRGILAKKVIIDNLGRADIIDDKEDS